MAAAEKKRKAKEAARNTTPAGHDSSRSRWPARADLQRLADRSPEIARYLAYPYCHELDALIVAVGEWNEYLVAMRTESPWDHGERDHDADADAVAATDILRVLVAALVNRDPPPGSHDERLRKTFHEMGRLAITSLDAPDNRGPQQKWTHRDGSVDDVDKTPSNPLAARTQTRQRAIEYALDDVRELVEAEQEPAHATEVDRQKAARRLRWIACELAVELFRNPDILEDGQWAPRLERFVSSSRYRDENGCDARAEMLLRWALGQCGATKDEIKSLFSYQDKRAKRRTE